MSSILFGACDDNGGIKSPSARHNNTGVVAADRSHWRDRKKDVESDMRFRMFFPALAAVVLLTLAACDQQGETGDAAPADQQQQLGQTPSN